MEFQYERFFFLDFFPAVKSPDKPPPPREPNKTSNVCEPSAETPATESRMSNSIKNPLKAPLKPARKRRLGHWKQVNSPPAAPPIPQAANTGWIGSDCPSNPADIIAAQSSRTSSDSITETTPPSRVDSAKCPIPPALSPVFPMKKHPFPHRLDKPYAGGVLLILILRLTASYRPAHPRCSGWLWWKWPTW